MTDAVIQKLTSPDQLYPLLYKTSAAAEIVLCQLHFHGTKNDCIFQQSSMSQGTYPLTLAERRSQKRTNVEIPKEEKRRPRLYPAL